MNAEIDVLRVGLRVMPCLSPGVDANCLQVLGDSLRAVERPCRRRRWRRRGAVVVHGHRMSAKRLVKWAMRRPIPTDHGQGRKTYKKRAPSIEPVFAQIKHNRGIRTISRRGLSAADSEWKLICTMSVVT
ncbi:MAG: transposase [Nocardioidaceae bacterium]|nr:transposase [Nocardioidaceae bacterium]